MFHRLRFEPRLPFAARSFFTAVALLCVYCGAASLAYSYRQRAANQAQSPLRLAVSPAPTAATRLLTFAPHCDDETLGTAGLMQQTLRAGGKVRTVLLTNGDGFPTAVQRQMRRLSVSPQDYVRFAALRQHESQAALENLGLHPDDVLFLGYPDRGLMALWNANWTADAPFTSHYTCCDHSPYANSYGRRSRYCGQNLVADIKAAMCAFRPTLVTVTHPAEDHADHAAAAAFVALALAELQADPKEGGWAKHTRLEYYLVHRGDWPAAQTSPASSLLPPAPMMQTDTHWTTRPLTTDETARKSDSIGIYESQTAVMGRFLRSFARDNEIFGEIAPTRLAVVSNGTIKCDADTADWSTVEPFALCAENDNLLRSWQGGGNLHALTACRDSRNLYLRVDTRQAVSRRVTFTVRLRTIGANGESSAKAFTVSLHPGDTGLPDGVHAAYRGRILEIAVPLANIVSANSPAPQMLAVSAETTLAGVLLDQTGVRLTEW